MCVSRAAVYVARVVPPMQNHTMRLIRVETTQCAEFLAASSSSAPTEICQSDARIDNCTQANQVRTRRWGVCGRRGWRAAGSVNMESGTCFTALPRSFTAITHSNGCMVACAGFMGNSHSCASGRLRRVQAVAVRKQCAMRTARLPSPTTVAGSVSRSRGWVIDAFWIHASLRRYSVLLSWSHRQRCRILSQTSTQRSS